MTFLLLVFGFLFQLPSDHDSLSNYQKGKMLVEEGFVKEGLDVWLNEWNTFQENNSYQIDPRVGFGFIDVAVEYNLSPTFRLASYLYMESLKSPKFPDYIDYLRSEIIPFGYLLDRIETKRFETMLKSDPVALSAFLLKTWEELDANPMTLINESLLEFYVRRIEAEKIFTNQQTLDERPRIHIRYASPLQKRRGTYRPSSSNIRNLIEDFFL